MRVVGHRNISFLRGFESSFPFPFGGCNVYFENGNFKEDLLFKNGKLVSGYLYDKYGNKTKMTKAHIHNFNK